MLDHLPDPIFLEILYRIPVNFLAKCMSVSKTWYSLIKSAEFIYSHLESSISRNAKDPHIVRLLHNEGVGFSLHFDSFESHERFHKQLNIPPLLSRLSENFGLVGYSNGIFCYALSQDGSEGIGYYQYLLWNPSIQKYFTLPSSEFECHFVAAFIFDSNANDFKVLAVDECLGIELFSLRSRSWKVISFGGPYSFCDDNYTFVDGAIYFSGVEDYDLKYPNRKYIMGFKLGDEVLLKIMLPESLDSSEGVRLIPYGNTSIAAVVFYRHERRELLLMEEISVSGTWKKVLLDMSRMAGDGGGLVDTFFGVWKGRLLFENHNRQVISLDLNCQHSKDVGLIQRFHSGYDNYYSIHRYEETLALLDIGKDINTLQLVDDASDGDDDGGYALPSFV